MHKNIADRKAINMKKFHFAALLLTIIMSVGILSQIAFAAPSPSPSASPAVAEQSKKSDTDSAPTETEKKASEFPVPRAESCIVIDSRSGDVIYALNADKKVFPAGLSNIMTAILVLENTSVSDWCVVTEDALKNITYDQPQLGIEVGERYTVEQLLCAILMNSNNDAANVLALKVGGTIEGFVQKMNEKAAEIGLFDTHFANPTGLQNENHYTTAADIATLSQYAMENPTFSKLVKNQKFVFPPTNMRTQEKTILSTNHLVSRYKYPYHYYANATGIKSGNSEDAGYCLAASAVKGNLSVISVVMNCPNEDANEKAYSFVDTKKIFDYVFENYQSVLLAKKGDVIYDSKVKEAKNLTRLALTVEDDVYITMKKTADPDIIENTVEVTSEPKAPIKQGDPFGTVTYTYNGKELRTANLVAANEVKRDFIMHIINSIFGFLFHPIVIIVVVLALWIWIKLRIAKNRKRRQRHNKMVSYNGSNRQQTRTGAYSGTSTRESLTRRNNDNYRRRR